MMIAHVGKPQADDSKCSVCHTATDKDELSIVSSHAIPPFEPAHAPTVTLSAPKNGKFYVDGEKPVVKLVVKDKAGKVIDPAAVTDKTYNRFRLHVSGPRANTVPVLTTAAAGSGVARAALTCAQSSPWKLSASDELAVSIDGSAAITVAMQDAATATANDVAEWLNGDASFSAVAVASATTDAKKNTDFVVITSKKQGDESTVAIGATAAATLMGWPTGVAKTQPGSYAYADLRMRTNPLDEDAMIKRANGAAGYWEYQLGDVKGLAAGTYTIFSQVREKSGATGTVKINFQVGTESVQAHVAEGCSGCHGDSGRFHGSYPMDPDVCKSCHDNKRQRTGYASWTTSNNGYGAAPLSRRLHGVHYGKYVDKPKEIHASYAEAFSKIIFPQDVRNCTKCHQKTSTWAEKPSRVACNACHDSDAAQGHAALQTLDPTPDEPFSGDEIETCNVCHGPNDEFAIDKVHNVWSPYKAPYPRAHEH